MFSGDYLRKTSEWRKALDGGYVASSVNDILNILREFNARVTFFILGELYEWYPETIERIEEEGHEIAYHTHKHEIIMDEQVFLDSLKASQSFVSKFAPKGFRAPDIFLPKNCLSILKKQSFLYDSSIYTCLPPKVFDNVFEVPVSSYPLIKRKCTYSFPSHLSLKTCLTEIPFGSGYYTALFGRKTLYFIKKFNKLGRQAVLFIHSWQIIKPRERAFPNMSYLAKNPWYLPYLFELKNTFIHFIKNLKVQPILEGLERGDISG